MAKVNPLQGATFWIFRAMIQVIPETTPDIDRLCPRSMAKVTYQDCVVQNEIQICGTSTANTDARGVMCTDARGSPFMDT